MVRSLLDVGMCWNIFVCVVTKKFKTSVSGSGMARDLEVAFEKKQQQQPLLFIMTPPVKLQFSLDDFLKSPNISIL